MRHGYRGPANELRKVGESAWDNNKITDTLRRCRPMVAAACRSHQRQSSEATAMLADGSTVY